MNKIIKTERSFIINDRYEIYFEDGCIYDTKKAQDIPQYIFKLRDNLIKKK